MASEADGVMDLRPETIVDCYNGTELDIGRYCQYLFRRNDEESEDDDIEDKSKRKQATSKKRSRRYQKKRKSKIISDGTLITYRPIDSTYYRDYIDSPDIGCDVFQEDFRERFRMPYDSFLKLFDEIKGHILFQKWTKCDCFGNPSSPMELLLLGVLHVLGRHDSSVSLYDLTNVSAEVHRVFFHKL